MLEGVRRFITRNRLLEPGDRVVVAVSGGPDSLALALVLHALQEEWRLALHVFHLHHGLRGEDADRDAAFVREVAARLGLPCTVARRDVRAEAGRLGGGLENAGRVARYRALAELAEQLGARRVAVGHTMDDQAESVLMGLLRGAGRRGLGGMAPSRPLGFGAPPDVTLIRPLLAVRRADTEQYVLAAGLEPRRDPMNEDPRFLRARLRTQLIPLLEEQYNPAVVTRLAVLAGIMRDEDDFLERQAREAARELGVGFTGREAVLPASALARLHPALGRRLVRLAGRAAGATLAARAVEQVLDLARRTGDGEAHLGRHLVAERAGDRIRLYRSGTGDGGAAAPLPGPVPLPVPGAVTLAGHRIVARAEGPAAFPAAGPWELDVDPDALPGPLEVRTRRPGDRVYPVGMTGSTKLQDLFVNRKIPRGDRDRVPLVVSGNEVVWVVGLRADRRFVARPGRPRVALRASRLAEPPPAG